MKNAAISLKQNGHAFLKITNYQKDLSFYYSNDGINWQSFGKGLRVNGKMKISLFAYGKGEATFKNFKYTGLEN